MPKQVPQCRSLWERRIMNKGRIISIVSNQVTVKLETKEVVDAIIMGKVRLDKAPIVGDIVKVEKVEDKYGIQEICERQNQLQRPLLANIDQVFVLMSTRKPDFSSLLADRMLAQVMLAHIHPVIVFTKMDKIDDPKDPIYDYIRDYQESGYDVILVDRENDLTPLRGLLKEKISVLSGNSGVGKSTLLNRLDESLQIKTQEVSKSLNRGKHTTTQSTLHPIEGGYLADTPGFSTISFEHVAKRDLALAINDFRNHLNCKFRDCLHDSEPHCAVKEGVKNNEISTIRYENYLKILQECEG